VKEYGFSQAVWQLCPQRWKEPLGDDWEDVLSTILWKWSPETYLTKERKLRPEQERMLKKNGGGPFHVLKTDSEPTDSRFIIKVVIWNPS
jgi:hypothetical protein